MTAINAVTDYVVENGIAVVTIDNPPVNALSVAVQDGLNDAVQTAIADDAVKAIVLICAGRTFIAGADIRGFGSGNAPPKAPFATVQTAMENSAKPVVAAIHGTALGGGLETALACHARIAADTARFGLPEVKLGLLPGGGGTQRLTRLTGAAKALEMMVSGDQINAQEALAIGLVDEIVQLADLRAAAIGAAQRIVASGTAPRPIRNRDYKIAADRANSGLFDDFRKANIRRIRNLDAPERIIQAVEAAVTSPSFEAGLAREAELFRQLMGGDQNKALIHNFFAERAAAKVDDIPSDTPLIPVSHVGIIGAGTMGRGIALAFLNGGYSVTIVEAIPAALEKTQALMRSSYDGQLKRGQITPDEVERRLAMLTPAGSLEAVADCDLVLEAIFEDMAVKKDLFGKLDAIVKPGAILASNTSYLDINEMAAVTSRPEALIGMHFFSPANIMKLLEVVRGAQTGKDVIATVMKLAGKIGKVPVLSGVCYGFIGNRMQRKRREVAERLILEGAEPARVDGVIERFGFPMGPFAMSDMAGLDVGWSAATSKGVTPKELMCEAGRFGQKNGKGYYDYDDKRNRTPSPEAVAIIRAHAAKLNLPTREFTDEEMLELLLFPCVNEGAKILDEGIAQRSSDIDVTWINGYSFPAYRGGIMYWADQIGLDKVLAGMEQLEARYGAEYAPAGLLRRLVAENRSFASV